MLIARRRGIDTRWVENCAFLLTRGRIEFLNPAAAIVWRALERPATRRNVDHALRAAYPALSPQRRAADLTRLLAQMARHGLVKIG